MILLIKLHELLTFVDQSIFTCARVTQNFCLLDIFVVCSKMSCTYIGTCRCSLSLLEFADFFFYIYGQNGINDVSTSITPMSNGVFPNIVLICSMEIEEFYNIVITTSLGFEV